MSEYYKPGLSLTVYLKQEAVLSKFYIICCLFWLFYASLSKSGEDFVWFSSSGWVTKEVEQKLVKNENDLSGVTIWLFYVILLPSKFWYAVSVVGWSTAFMFKSISPQSLVESLIACSW